MSITILITSGGTKVKIDGVRHVGNMSSGRFGAELAREALRQGHQVVFLHAKGSERPDQVKVNLKEFRDPQSISMAITSLFDIEYNKQVQNNLFAIEYSTFDEYTKELEKWCKRVSFVMLAAAVSDYGIQDATNEKISSDKNEITFTMTKLPKLIAKVKEWNPSAFLVGFKLLVGASKQEMKEAADKQIAAAKSNIVLVNDLIDIKNGNHTIHLFDANDGSQSCVIHDNLAQQVITKTVSKYLDNL